MRPRITLLYLVLDIALLAGGLYWAEPWPVVIGAAGLVVDALFLRELRKEKRNPS
jgi:hypothetical protein